MIEWYASLDTVMKVLWTITLAASFIFVIQTVMTFIGADGMEGGSDFGPVADTAGDLPDGDINADAAAAHDLSGIGLLSFRNLVNFCLGFGWSAVLLRGQIASDTVLFIVATITGIGLVACVMLLFKWLYSMQQTGNINVFTSAVGCVGKVYLTIPGDRKGQGKVQITINNAVREYNAVTDDGTLSTGTDIKVVEVINASTLLVEEINSLII